MINEKLLTYDYYINYLSMFMQNSFGIKDRVKLYVDLLNNSNNISNKIFNYLDITNPDYFNIINNNLTQLDPEYIDPNGYESELLDFIANIFGLNRNLNISYEKDGININENIKLTNKQLQIYIVVTIAKNNYHGTMEELHTLYDKVSVKELANPQPDGDTNFINNIYYYINDNNVYIRALSYDPTKQYYIDSTSNDRSTLHDLGIEYMTMSNPLSCKINFNNYINYLTNNNEEGNIIKLFRAGLLTIESLGINYIRECVTPRIVAIFDDNDTDHLYFDAQPTVGKEIAEFG